MEIKVGEKKYEVPKLTVKQYRTALEVIDRSNLREKELGRELLESENIVFMTQFLLQILRPAYPELTEEDMSEMPLYQIGAAFYNNLHTFLKVPPEEYLEDLRNIRITVGDTEYPVPDLKVGEYLPIAKQIEGMVEKETSEADDIRAAIDFLYGLVVRENPEIKIEDLEDMPLYQVGRWYFEILKAGLMQAPLPKAEPEKD